MSKSKALKWTKVKPDKPCIFLTRNKDAKGHSEYSLYELNCGDGYLRWCDSDGMEIDDYANCVADEYMIIEYIKESERKWVKLK
jgi:hypothetical protein